MEAKIVLPALFFIMKYFFHVEKEIVQQMLVTVQVRLLDCKELAAQLYGLVAAQK